MKLVKLASGLVLSCALFSAPFAHAITFEALGNPAISENGGALEIMLRLSATALETVDGPCDISVIVETDDGGVDGFAITTADVDYVPVLTSLPLSLPQDSSTDVSTTEVVTIPILNDTMVEAADEVFQLTVDPAGATCFSDAVPELVVDLVINDDDPLQFVLTPDASANENEDGVVLSLSTLNLDMAPTVTADVTVATADGTATAGEDYESLTDSLFINANNPEGQIAVGFLDDLVAEGDETFAVSVTAINAVINGFPVLTNVQPPTSVVTIVDNDQSGGGGSVVIPDVDVEFTDDLVFFLENAPFAIVELIPSASPSSDVTVDFMTEERGSAESPADFIAVAGTVTFPAGTQEPQTIMIPLVNDSEDENQEVFDVVLSNPLGVNIVGSDTATVAIRDNDTGVSSDVTLTGAPGSTVTFTFNTNSDTSSFGTQQAFSALTIAGADPATVTYSAIIPANASDGQTFDDGVVNNIDVPPPSVVFITLVADSSTATTTTEYGFAVVGPDVAEGAGSIDLQVRRTGDLSNSGEVSFQTLTGGTATAGADFVATTGVVVFAPGEAGPVIAQVDVLDDTDVEGDEEFQVELFDPIGGVVSTGDGLAIVTIVDDDNAPPPVASTPGTVQFAVAELAVNESGDTITLEVTRINGSDGDASVEFLTVEDTATDGEDFTGTSGTLTWPAGDSDPRTISIELIADPDAPFGDPGDFSASTSGSTTTKSTAKTTRSGVVSPLVIEGIENFSVILQNPVGVTLGTPAQVTISINDLGRDIAGIPGLSANQREMATWFDTNCDRLIGSNPTDANQQDLAGVCANVRSVNTTDDQVRDALDAINAEEIATAATTTLRLLGDQHGNLQRRINGLRSGASGIDLAGLSVSVGGQQISGAALEEMLHGLTWGAVGGESDFGRWGFFVDGKIDFGDRDANDANNGYDFDSTLITVGADYRVRDNFFLGGAFGYANADVDFADGGGLDFDSYRGSLYSTFFAADSYYLDGLITYGTTDYDSDRRIRYADAGGTIDRTATGSTDGTMFTIGFGTGFDFNRGPFTFGPNLGAYYYDVDVDAYTESGAGGLNLNIGDQNAKSLTVNAGGHASWVINTKWGVLIPNARFDWVHEFEDSVEEVSIRFAADPFINDPTNPSSPITVRSEQPDENYFVWSVGASAQFVRGFSGFVTYQATEGFNDLKLNEVSFGMRYEKTF